LAINWGDDLGVLERLGPAITRRSPSNLNLRGSRRCDLLRAFRQFFFEPIEAPLVADPASIALKRPPETSHAHGFSRRTPSRDHCLSAARNASESTSSARSNSPREPYEVAKTRRDSVR
jgi:hypothetical protein